MDAPNLPILTALNIHPLPRRMGLMVLRSELEMALGELGLDTSIVPYGRLLEAGSVEKLLESTVGKGLATALSKAIEVFESPIEAVEWMSDPLEVLGGKSPAAMCRTAAGTQEVLHVLGRLENGIFS